MLLHRVSVFVVQFCMNLSDFKELNETRASYTTSSNITMSQTDLDGGENRLIVIIWAELWYME